MPADELSNLQLPHSVMAEQAVLGSMLIDDRCVSDVMARLLPDDFYMRQNRDLFSVLFAMFNRLEAIDPVTVLDRMKQAGVYDDNTTVPYLRQLMEFSGETVHLVQLDGVNAIYINKMESDDNSLRLVSRIGKRIPLYCSGVGKALLADMADDQIHKIWLASHVRKLTENTITDWETFLETIRTIRKDGFAFDNEENEIGVKCVATTLDSHDPNTSYAVSVSGPASRMTDDKTDKLADKLLEIKKRIGPI